MILTNEEREERHKVVGYCERCLEWYKFVDDLNNADSRKCPKCQGNPSMKAQFQITTQRSFNPSAKKLSKAAAKKMGLGA